MNDFSSRLFRRWGVSILFVGLAGFAPHSRANNPFLAHYQKEFLSLPMAQYSDSRLVDVNNDGNLDLLALSDAELYVSLGDGTGQFAAAQGYDMGAFQEQFAVGDFNGDGYADVVVTVDYPSSINVLLNDGAGGFLTPTTISGPSAPLAVRVADFNRDGKADVAVSDPTSDSIYILLGDGNGGFAAPIIVAAGTHPGYLVVGDFDHDGVLDLAVSGAYPADDLRTFKGAGDGTFTLTGSYPLTWIGNTIVKGDFNHDGNTDLAVNVSSTVQVWLGDGMGGFTQGATVSTPRLADAFSVGDFNGDGILDLSYKGGTKSGIPQVGIALGNGDGTFGVRHNVSIARAAGLFGDYSLCVGDVNGDGRDDIFTPQGRGVLLLSTR